MTPELSQAVWRKSSYSVGNGECVEVSSLGAVRDSKNAAGPVLVFDQSALATFITEIKTS